MIRSILVLKPSSLGDIVHTLPAVAHVRRAWPEARLRWLINPEWAPLLEGNTDVDERILFPRRELAGFRPLKQLQWLRTMRATYPSELVLDFQGLSRSAIIGRACRQGPGSRLLGLSDAREGARFAYDAVVRVGLPGREHAVARYLDLAAAAGADITGPLEWRLPEGTPPAQFSLNAAFVLLHPFSRGAGKSLTPEQVIDFCHTLKTPVVLAGRADAATAQTDWPENVTNLLNQTTLGELIWLIRKARFVVSVDSGPMHIAAALTPHLLSIHTWSDPALVGPYHPEAWIWKDRTLFQMHEMCEPQPSFKKPRTAPDVLSLAAFVSEKVQHS